MFLLPLYSLGRDWPGRWGDCAEKGQRAKCVQGVVIEACQIMTIPSIRPGHGRRHVDSKPLWNPVLYLRTLNSLSSLIGRLHAAGGMAEVPFGIEAGNTPRRAMRRGFGVSGEESGGEKVAQREPEGWGSARVGERQ